MKCNPCTSVVLFGILPVLIFPVALSCGGSSETSFLPGMRSRSVQVDFERTGSGDYSPFAVKVTARNESSSPVSGLTVTVVTSKGSAGPVSDGGSGIYLSTVTPGMSGEYRITVNVAEWGLSAERTAVVLKNVHADWGQPQAVSGNLVNTGGWEDSINVTPDGEWLLMMYSPMSFGGLFVAPSHPWAKNAAGPWTGPERPGFPRGRISDGGVISHSFPLFCIPDPGVVVQPTIMYGFKRLSDGSFGNPFLVGVIDETNNDTMIQHGPHVASAGGANLLVFNFNDPGIGGDKERVYAVNIALGGTSILGRYFSTGCPGFDRKNFSPELVPLEEPGGTLSINDPHAWTEGGSVKSIWAWKQSDEKDDSTKKIYVYVLKSGKVFWGSKSDDWDVIELPDPINTGPTGDMQPHFTGDSLYYYRDGRIVVANYKGGAYGDGGSWDAPATLMEAGYTGTVGEIFVVSEPTLCTYKGREALFFAYGVVEAQDGPLININFNAGFVEMK